ATGKRLGRPPKAPPPPPAEVVPIDGKDWDERDGPDDESEPLPLVTAAVTQAFEGELSPEEIEHIHAQEKKYASAHFPSFVMFIHRALNSGDEFQLKALHNEIFKFLQDAYEGKMLFGYVNIPPRHGKSYLMALWISWCYGRHPDSYFMYCAYGADLAEDTSMLVQRVMALPEYVEIFPEDACRINPKAASRTMFQTMKGGICIARGIEGTVTGKGAGRRNALNRFSGAVIFDDLHKPGEAASEPMKHAVK